jgi:Mrp family chromosome partitioning ATPase
MAVKRKAPRRKSGPPSYTPATWISARARNAIRRPAYISMIGGLTFIVALAALLVVPRQAKRSANRLRTTASQRPDTMPTVAALAQANRDIAAGEATLASERQKINALIAASAQVAARDTAANGALLSPDVRQRRDQLTLQVDSLAKLIDRSQNAPLLNSYRALAQSPAMQGDARVKAMLDSLVDIERERDSYSAAGGVDPVFVSLTARANELGKNITTLAEARRLVMKRDLAALAPPPPAAPTAIAQQPPPDTMATISAIADARVAAAGVTERLAKERADLARLDAQDERANELANLGATPSTMLVAALVLAAMLGFGLSLFREVRHPHVADMFEAERVTGLRVLSVVKPLRPHPERKRRSADREGPKYMDSGGDGHQLIYLTIASAGSNTVVFTITGDSAAVSAVVAVNFASIAADEARATIIVDANAAEPTVAQMLRIDPSDGLSDVVRQRREWAEVLRTVRIGRDRAIDVVTSGTTPVSGEDVAKLLAEHGTRLARRYDAVIVVCTPEQVRTGVAAALPVTDVVYCARAGVTAIDDLKAAVTAMKEAGANPKGLVLWNAVEPTFEAKGAAARASEHPRSPYGEPQMA